MSLFAPFTANARISGRRIGASAVLAVIGDLVPAPNVVAWTDTIFSTTLETLGVATTDGWALNPVSNWRHQINNAALVTEGGQTWVTWVYDLRANAAGEPESTTRTQLYNNGGAVVNQYSTTDLRTSQIQGQIDASDATSGLISLGGGVYRAYKLFDLGATIGSTFFEVNDFSPPDGYDFHATNQALFVGQLSLAQIEALPAPAGGAPANVAPTIDTQPSMAATVEAGTDLVVSIGAASGTPEPTASLSVTVNSQDASGRLTGATIDTTGLSADDLIEVVVTWSNGEAPDAVSSTISSTVTVAVVSQAPDAFGVNDWDLDDSPSANGDALTITLNALPANNGSSITNVEYRLDTGSGFGVWQNLGSLTTGVAHPITVLAETETDVEIRAVNAVDVSDPSLPKTATPTTAEAQPATGDIVLGERTASGVDLIPTMEADGDYGELEVVNGQIRSKQSTLTVGDHAVGSTTVTVLNDADTVYDYATFEAALFATKSSGTSEGLVVAGSGLIDVTAVNWTGCFAQRSNFYLRASAMKFHGLYGPLEPNGNGNSFKFQGLRLVYYQGIRPDPYSINSRIIAECKGTANTITFEDNEFESDMLPCLEGGLQINWVTGISTSAATVAALYSRRNTFKHLSHAHSVRADILMIEENHYLENWGDFVTLADPCGSWLARSYIRNNHIERPVTDNTSLHADIIQMVRDNSGGPFTNIHICGNTVALGNPAENVGAQTETSRTGVSYEAANVALTADDVGKKITLDNETSTDAAMVTDVTLPEGATVPIGATITLVTSGSDHTIPVYLHGSDIYAGSHFSGQTGSLLYTIPASGEEKFVQIYWDGSAWQDLLAWHQPWEWVIDQNITVGPEHHDCTLNVYTAAGPVTVTMSDGAEEVDLCIKNFDGANPVTIVAASGAKLFDIQSQGGGHTERLSSYAMTRRQQGIRIWRNPADGGKDPSGWYVYERLGGIQVAFSNDHAPGVNGILMYGNGVYSTSHVLFRLQEENNAGSHCFGNTGLQPLVDDFDGNGVIGVADGYVDKGPSVEQRAEVCVMRNLLSGGIDLVNPAKYAARDLNIAMIGDNTSPAALQAAYATHLHDASLATQQPSTRAEVIAAITPKAGSLAETAGIGATAVWDFATGQLRSDLPAPVPLWTLPGQGAVNGLTDGSDLWVSFDWPLELLDGALVTLTNVTDGVTVTGTVTVKGAHVIFNPDTPLVDGKAYTLTIASGAICHILDQSKVAATVALSFTADANAEINYISDLDGAGDYQTALISESWTALTQRERFDTSRQADKPAYLPTDANYTFTSEVRGTGTVKWDVRLFGTAADETYSLTIDLDNGGNIIASTMPGMSGANYGVQAADDGYRLWFAPGLTGMTRYYMDWNAEGDVDGQEWRRPQLVRVTNKDAVFVAPKNAWAA